MHIAITTAIYVKATDTALSLLLNHMHKVTVHWNDVAISEH